VSWPVSRLAEKKKGGRGGRGWDGMIVHKRLQNVQTTTKCTVCMAAHVGQRVIRSVAVYTPSTVGVIDLRKTIFCFLQGLICVKIKTTDTTEDDLVA
jgi:hydrogenase maturation factor HypE